MTEDNRLVTLMAAIAEVAGVEADEPDALVRAVEEKLESFWKANCGLAEFVRLLTSDNLKLTAELRMARWKIAALEGALEGAMTAQVDGGNNPKLVNIVKGEGGDCAGSHEVDNPGGQPRWTTPVDNPGGQPRWT